MQNNKILHQVFYLFLAPNSHIGQLLSLSGSLNFLATSLLSYTAFLTAERKRITKSLNHKLVSLGIEDKLLISEDNISEKSV